MATHLGHTDLPIYRFRQPARLSSLELPFAVLPVRSVHPHNLAVLEVAEREARDSWFPGYAWSILLCKVCEGYTHLGWKFTPIAGGEPFYGLIVGGSREEERARAKARTAEVEPQLHIGVRAAGWMVELAKKSGLFV
jgi:hypothetical protein